MPWGVCTAGEEDYGEEGDEEDQEEGGGEEGSEAGGERKEGEEGPGQQGPMWSREQWISTLAAREYDSLSVRVLFRASARVGFKTAC